MAAFVLSVIVNEYPIGQVSAIGYYLILCERFLWQMSIQYESERFLKSLSKVIMSDAVVVGTCTCMSVMIIWSPLSTSYSGAR